MEDAVEQLDKLARDVTGCTRCEELAGSRLRAVPGKGHPHCSVMVIGMSPDPTDENAGRSAGSALIDALAEFMPALATSRDKVYGTTLVKCVPRSGGSVREALPDEENACFPFLSRELSITTPHYLLTIGENTTRHILNKLFKDLSFAEGDSLELRVFDSPSFKVVPVATPEELRLRDDKARKTYVERLHSLAQVMGLSEGSAQARTPAVPIRYPDDR